jgi:acetyl-CoA carboxylase beta subunit
MANIQVTILKIFKHQVPPTILIYDPVNGGARITFGGMSEPT